VNFYFCIFKYNTLIRQQCQKFKKYSFKQI